MTERRQWTLEAACEILADVRERTRRAVEVCESLAAQGEAPEPGAGPPGALEEHLSSAVAGWAREMEALGLETKGLWLVDFDNGSGYYCWRWPEMRLEWFHGYEDGFAGRVRIQ